MADLFQVPVFELFWNVFFFFFFFFFGDKTTPSHREMSSSSLDGFCWGFWKKNCGRTRSLTVRPSKIIVEKRSFPFGSRFFQFSGRALKLPAGNTTKPRTKSKFKLSNSLKSIHHPPSSPVLTQGSVDGGKSVNLRFEEHSWTLTIWFNLLWVFWLEIHTFNRFSIRLQGVCWFILVSFYLIRLMAEIRPTSWYGKFPMIYRVLYIPGGCLGFLNHQRGITLMQ